MAWASVGALGVARANSTANQASSALTLTVGAAAGSVVILVIAVDNAQTTDGDESGVSSVTDSVGGNTWVKAKEFTNGQGTAQAGAMISVWYSALTNALLNTSTITANFTNATSRDVSVMRAWNFTMSAGATLSVAGSSTAAVDGSPAGAVTVSGLTSGEYLWVRATATETNTTGVQGDPAFTTIVNTATTGGGAAANMAALAEFEIFTGTSLTHTPANWPTGDNASVMFALKATGGSNNFTVNVSDSLTYSDAATKSTGKALTQALTFTETPLKSIGAVRTDTLSLSESRTLSVGKVIVEPLSVSDVAVKNVSIVRTEPYGLSEVITQSVTKQLAESLTLTDAKLLTASILKSESISFTDQVSTLILIQQLLQESCSFIDTCFKDVQKALSDPLSLSDVLSKTVAMTRNESLSFTDIFLLSTSLLKSEIFLLTDSRTAAVSKLLGDTLSMADSAGVSGTGNINISDTLSFSDLTTFAVAKVAIDALGLNDVAKFNASIVRGDVLSYIDSVSKTLSRTLLDQVAFTDAVMKQTARLVTDSLVFSDASLRTTGKVVVDPLTFTDAAIKALQIVRTDTLSLQDVALKVVAFTLADTLLYSDAQTKVYVKWLVEQLDFTDDATALTNELIKISLIAKNLLRWQMAIADNAARHMSAQDVPAVQLRVYDIQDELQ